jgi:hypothetical protein
MPSVEPVMRMTLFRMRKALSRNAGYQVRERVSGTVVNVLLRGGNSKGDIGSEKDLN